MMEVFNPEDMVIWMQTIIFRFGYKDANVSTWHVTINALPMEVKRALIWILEDKKGVVIRECEVPNVNITTWMFI